jgi:hypothetical protein
VRTLTEILTRVDTGAEVIAGAGTFRYVRDPGGTLQLSVHLAGGADPSGSPVLVETVFCMTIAGLVREHLVQPDLGEEKFLDAGIDLWDDPTTPTEWLTAHTGGFTANQDDPLQGTSGFSCRLQGNLVAGTEGIIYQAPSNVDSGSFNRFFGLYLTPRTFPATASLNVRVGTTTALSADGRTSVGSLGLGLTLEPSRGKVRAFLFDFISHETAPQWAIVLHNTNATACEAWVDNLSGRMVHGWDFYEPRVAPGGLPETSQGATDIFPGSETTGSGEVRLINGDGAMWEMFSPNPWSFSSRQVEILLGGVFQGGQEIAFNDLWHAFSGVINGEEAPSVDDREAVIPIEDVRTLLESKLPRNSYTDVWTGVEARDAGRARALVFGIKFHARPARVGISGTGTGYGIYELCDTTGWPTGIGGAGPAAGGAVYAYPDEESADKQDDTKRVELDSTVDYSTDLGDGTMEILHDVRVIHITRENNKIDFHIGGADLVATIPGGYYIIGNGDPSITTFRRGLLEEIRSQLSTVSGVSIGGSYDESTHLVTLFRAKGTLTFKWNTGINSATSIGPTLGFDGGADDTGGVSYVADSALFTDPDSTHIVRADIAGIADDAAGTYTGTPGDTIQKASDILRFILIEILKVPSWRVDMTSFLAARASNPEPLGVYLGALNGPDSSLTLAEFIDRLEAGAMSDIGPDGSGVFRFGSRTKALPADAPHLRDNDYLSFRGFFVPSEVFRHIRLNYDRNPVTGQPRTVEADVEEAELLHGRSQEVAFEVYLTQEADVIAVMASYVALAQAPVRHFCAVVKGKLLKTNVGDQILITRRLALTGVGASDVTGDVMRVYAIKKNHLTHRCEVYMHTNVLS